MVKKYKGFDALFRMKEAWVTLYNEDGSEGAFAYRYEDGVILRIDLHADGRYVKETDIRLNFFFKNEFIDWHEPLAAGTPVKITLSDITYYGSVTEEGRTTDFEQYVKIVGSLLYFNREKVERITPEELVAAQREGIFKLAGRKLDEFSRGDIVKYNGFESIVRGVEGNSLLLIGEYNGYVSAKELEPHQFANYTNAVAPILTKVKKVVAPCTAPPMPGLGQPLEYIEPKGGRF